MTMRKRDAITALRFQHSQRLLAFLYERGLCMNGGQGHVTQSLLNGWG